jgi:hypothetical protein
MKHGVLLASCLLIAGCAFGEGPRRYTMWRAEQARQQVGCATVDAWVSRSGRDGVGVTLRMRGNSQKPCKFVLGGVELRAGSKVVPADRLPPAPLLTDRSEVLAYVAFVFENTAEDRRGALFVRADGAEGTLPLVQEVAP